MCFECRWNRSDWPRIGSPGEQRGTTVRDTALLHAFARILSMLSIYIYIDICMWTAIQPGCTHNIACQHGTKSFSSRCLAQVTERWLKHTVCGRMEKKLCSCDWGTGRSSTTRRLVGRKPYIYNTHTHIYIYKYIDTHTHFLSPRVFLQYAVLFRNILQGSMGFQVACEAGWPCV